MRYPVLTNSKCSELATQLVGGQEPAVEPHVNWIGQGEELNLEPIEEVARKITEEARAWADSDRDRFEGKVSKLLYEVLSRVPTQTLDDRGFWRFLSLRYFWDFIGWREEGPFSKGNYLKYVNAATNTESVLPRMYLRAHALGGDADLAGAVPYATDFWRSHVIRVRTGAAPAVTRALAERQAADRLMTGPLRQAARRLNRMWTNIVLHIYDGSEAKEIVDGVWSDEDG